MADIQKRLQAEVEKYQALDKELQQTAMTKQQLDAQLNENLIVQEELDLVEDGGPVYKLIGPALVKQEMEEAKQTVKKRVEYITGEGKRVESRIEDLQKKKESQMETLSKLQQQFQQAQVKAAAKA